MSKIRKLSMTFFAIVASLLLAFSLVGVGNLAFAAQVGEDVAVSSVTVGENVTYHDSLQSAVDAAPNGATVTLLRDATETVSVSKSLTLDLGKHTLSATTGSAVTVSTVSEDSETAVVITNGAIVAKGDTDTDVIGVTAFAVEANSKCMVTLTDSLTVTASENCVYAYGKAIVNTSAMLTSDGLFPAIQTDETSGMRGGTTVNVVGGSVTHANGTAIYFPSEKGTLNISGGVVSGKVAVEVRGGTVNVSGGELVASGEYKASETTAEGRIYESGVALGIAKMQNREVSASVSNGSISAEEGGKALQVDAEISSFVSGGTFSQSIDASYIAEGSVVTDEGGTTTVVVGEQSDYVARIGTTGYDSLQSAVSAAKSGETVYLLCNVEIGGTVNVSQDITIDLGGFTVTTTSSNNLFYVHSTATQCEIKNGTIVGIGTPFYLNRKDAKVTLSNLTVDYSGSVAIIQTRDYCTNLEIVVTGCDFTSQTAVVANLYGTSKTDSSIKGSSLTIVDSNVTSVNNSAIVCWSNTSVMVENGSIITATRAAAISNNGTNALPTEITINGGKVVGSTAIYHPGVGTLNVNGGEIIGDDCAIELRNGTLNVTDGIITAKTDFSETPNGSGSTITGAAIAISQHSTKGQITVNISGGELKYLGTDPDGKAFYETDIQNEPGTAPVPTISISGGKFAGGVVSTRADNYISGGNFTVAPGYSEFVDGYSVKVGEDGVLEVVQQSFVAVVDNVGYHSLQEAIGAAGSGATVTLLKDTSETVNIAEGKDIVLDLNGKTLTSDKASTATVSNDGTVRITSSVEGGKITRGTTRYYVILNHGTMTIDGAVTVENTNGSDTSSLIDNGWYNPADRPEGKYAVLTIDGGEFVTATPIAIKNDEFGRLTVNGGTFTATNQSVQNWGYAELHGGHFTSQVIGWSYDNMPDDKYGTVIDGGKYDSGVGSIYSGATGNVMGYLVPDKASPLDISGGSFKSAIHYSYYADGHVADVTKVDEEGYVTVEANETGYVAAVGGIGYVSLQTAINAAGSGATVTLLKDTSETVNIAEGKDIVLDLNGKTLTSDKASTATVSNDGTVRITSSVEGGKITRGTTRYYVILNHGTMTIDGAVTVENTNGSDTSSLIDNGWYNPADRPEGKYAVLTIDGGEFVTATPIAIKNDEFGRLTVNGGTFTATNQSVQNWGYAELHGGHFTSQVIGWSYDNMPDDKYGTVIDGGKYDSGVGSIYSGATGNVMGYLVPDKASPLDISGGSFKSAIHYSYYADGHVADVTKVDEEGYVTVEANETGYVAAVGGIGYVSLQTAINAAGSGATVTLLKDTSETVNIAEGKDIVLDLNGKTLTSDKASTATVSNDGTVRITSSVEGGKITRGTTRYYVILNHGTMTIDGAVTVENTNGSDTSSLIDNGWYNPADRPEGKYAVLTIDGGEFVTATPIAIKNDEFGRLTVNGGTFTATNQSVQNWGYAELHGGHFTSQVIGWSYDNMPDDKYGTVIDGGKYDSGVGSIYSGATGNVMGYLVPDKASPLDISGGSFKSAIHYSYYADGHVADVTKVDEEGYVTVEANEKGYVAAVGGVGYVDFIDALGALRANSTLTLLNNVQLGASLQIGVNLNFDLNGYTITSTLSKPTNVLFAVVGSDVTVNISNGTVVGTGEFIYVFNNVENVNVNCNNLTLTSSNSAVLFGSQSCKNVLYTFTDCTLTNNTTGGSVAELNNSKAILNNTKSYANGEDSFNVLLFNNSAVEVNDGTEIYAPNGVGIYTNGSNTVETNIEINGGKVSAAVGIYQAGRGTLTVNGGEIVGVESGIELRAGTLNINSGTISATADFATQPNGSGTTVNGVAVAISQHSTKLPITVNISGGELKYLGTDPDGKAFYETDIQNEPGTAPVPTISISGGAFAGSVVSERVDNYISDGKFTVAPQYTEFADGRVLDTATVDEEGYATVVEGEYVALNNGIGYVSLQSAIDAVPTGETITLLCDVTESVVIPEGKEVTIDLNEKTITNIDGQHTITNNGTLTIEGVGTVDNVSHGKAALYNNGVAVLNGGVYSRSLEAGTATGANGNSWYTIFNDGDLTVNAGVEVCQRKESTNNFSSLVENGYNKPATLTINGGTFTAGLNAVKNDSGTVTIKDGTFLGGGDDAEQKSVLNWDTLEIHGGTFENVVQTWTWTDSTTGEGSHATTNIHNGTFNGGVVAETYHGEEAPAPVVNITGGTFTGTVSGNKAEINVSAGKFSSAISATESKVTVSGSFDGEVSTDGNSTIKVEIDEMAMETVVYYIGVKENFVVATLEEVPEGAVLIAGRSEVSNFDGYTVDEDYIVLQEPDTGYWKIMDVQDFAAYAADYIAGYATKLAESGRYSAGGIYDLNVLAEMAASEMEKVDITADFDLVKQITELYTASMDAVTTRIDYEVALKEAKAQALADVRLYASLQGVALTDEITALVNGESVVAISQVSEGKLAAYDAIDALAQEGATSLDEAKENAVAEIIAAANAEGETAVVVPTATLHAIYDARTVEEVEIYRTNALAEIADIRTYRQQIDDLVNDTTVMDAVKALSSALLGDGEQQGKLAEMQAAFEAKIAEVQTTLATLATSEEVAQLKSDLQSYIDGAVEEFTTAISGLFEHITAMETSLTTLGESVTAVCGKVDAANTALTELQQALETLQDTVGGLNNVSMEEIQAAIDGATQQFSQAMQDMSADIGELKTTLTALGESVTAVSGKVDESNQALTALQNAITTLQGTVDGLNNVSMEEIQTAITSATGELQSAISGIATDLDGLNQSLTTLSSDLATVGGNVTALNGTVATIQSAVTTLQSTVDGLNNVSLAEIQTAIDALETSVTQAIDAAETAVTEQLTAISGKVDTLTGALATTSSSLTTQIGEIKEAIAAIEATSPEAIAQLNATLADIGTKLTALDQKVTALTAVEESKTEGKQEIDNWLNSYVETMLASVSVGKQKSGLFTTATAAELSTTLKDKLVTLFGTENAQLVEKYYNDAMEAIDRAESVSDVNIAVSAFQTKVAMVEVVSGITSTTATQPTSDVEIFVLLAVAVVFGLVTVVLAMVVLSKRNK